MKTTKEIIEEYYIDADEQWDNIEEGMQKYAEEYAKAYLSYLVKKGYAKHGDIDGFKESLKK